MSKIRSIFISRDLEQDSIFWQLQKKGIDVKSQSLLQFKLLHFKFENKTDWLFFYSKMGIKAFSELYTLDGDFKIGVMGDSSNRFLEEQYGRNADYVFYDRQNPEELKELTKNQSITFIQAAYSKKRFQKELKIDREVKSIVAYTNIPKTTIDIDATDILIFTSPLNAKKYFESYPDRSDLKLIAIGPTTQEMILKLTGQIAIIPAQPYEKDLYDLIVSSFIL